MSPLGVAPRAMLVAEVDSVTTAFMVVRAVRPRQELRCVPLVMRGEGV